MDIKKKEVENMDTEINEDTKKTDEKIVLKEDATSLVSTIFTKANFILIAWFLGIYFITYFILGYFFPGSATNNQSLLSKTIDILLVTCFLIIVITTFYSMSDSQKENFFSNFLSGFKDFVNNPNSLLSVFSFILIFYLIIYLFRFPMTAEEKSMGLSFIENTTWVLFIILIVVNFFKYLLKIPIIDILTKLFVLEEKKDEDNTKEKKVGEQGEEVFNVSNNLYTYEDAQAICSAYDAKLATYDQIESAYNDGAEWCNYGWSDGQMIFFPTQKTTWDKLQKIENHKNDCGRPGVNGGYIANPYAKFGVNCYGKKPKASDADIARMNANKGHIYPKNKKDIELEEKVNYWKQNADKMLNINAFNVNRWFENWTGAVTGNTVVAGNTIVAGNTVCK
jgi:hypothetical protein